MVKFRSNLNYEFRWMDGCNRVEHISNHILVVAEFHSIPSFFPFVEIIKQLSRFFDTHTQINALCIYMYEQ